ncbi:uncharacterized protein F4812DRAFT_431159 [Daldinia caldariorum]|uniref:uncharacterized protein n=1 Tax=Daldinia caldariorum TaxID=326644 RepID=UPI0020087E75|nr:uncharacterized protein F4812DRAFT_431159 [Daldinia caldariorum]KAI1467091.1 hypothetical protein F4812DRAFT_431159 [Daldinia caldariorum]
MLACQSCTRKAFSTLINHTIRLQNSLAIIRPIYTPAFSRRHRRKYATVAAPFEGSKQKNNGHHAKPSGRVSPREWAANKQLQYLKDPLHIADHVKKTLEKDQFEDALLITRKASKDTKVTVSWNYLIDHLMRQGRLHAGIKLFNEMKKRAQFPNAQTYTTIFNGCAISPHPQLAVTEAIRIYNNMLANERLKPNTIHLNALLKVCAHAEDIESLFTIVQTANEGIRAPNNLTYTIILNALQRKVNRRQYGRAQEVDTPQITKAKAKTVQRAKAIWEEVIAKWRAGNIIIDEELVCSMGWILLMGDWHDADSIEGLLEQTMMIPRENKPAISGEAGKAADPGPSESTADPKPAISIGDSKILAPGAPSYTHALPGRNSLSLILTALEKTGKTARAQRYWDIFTKEHGVVPDANNWHRMLIALRRGKNSAQTAELLREIPAKLVLPKNFRTAMNTCLRNNLNRAVFDHATHILDLMPAKLGTPDPITLRNYLRVCNATKKIYADISKKKRRGATMTAWVNQLATALRNVWGQYVVLQRLYGNDGPESNMKRELIALARKMIAASDVIISKKVVSLDIETEVAQRRNNLNRAVVRHFEQMRAIDPNFVPEEEVEDEEGEIGEDEEDGSHHKTQLDVSLKRPKKPFEVIIKEKAVTQV